MTTHSHPETDALLHGMQQDIGEIKATVARLDGLLSQHFGENGLPKRLRSLEESRSETRGSVTILKTLFGLATLVGLAFLGAALTVLTRLGLPLLGE